MEIKELSIILPAYKEEENLKIILPHIKEVLKMVEKNFEIIVVDTKDPLDNTKKICEENEIIYVNRIGFNNYYGDAIRTGIKKAVGKYIIFMDADGSHDPEFIKNLYENKENQDIVVASRYVVGGNTDNSRISIFLSWMVNFVYSLVLNIKCKDISNSFKLYKTSDLKELNLSCNNFDIIEEIIFKIKKKKGILKIKEIPFLFKKRMFGNTKRNLLLFVVSYFKTLLKLRWGESFDKLWIYLKELFNFLKNNLIAFLSITIFIFLVIWAGKLISIVSSREILDPLTIKIEGLNNESLSSMKVLATLSRSNNTIGLASAYDQPNEWNNQYKTFVGKILLGFKPKYLENFTKVSIDLGNKNFIYSKTQFFDEWKRVNFEAGSLLLSDFKGDADYIVYEAPADIKADPLNYSFLPSIFSSINFNAGEKLIQKPLISSIKLFLFLETLLLFFCFLWIMIRKKTSEEQNNIEIVKYQQDFVIGGLSIVFTFLVLFIFNILIFYFYKPDISRVLTEAAKIYLPSALPAFLPKPVERLQFVISILMSPFLLLFLYKLLKKNISVILENFFRHAYYFLSVFFPLVIFSMVYIGLATSNFLYINHSFSFSASGKYLYSFLFFPIGVFLVFFLDKEKYKKSVKYFIYGFCGILLVILLSVNIFSFNNEGLINDYYFPIHFDPVFYPITQVMAGKTMLINLTGLYGLYPVFLQGMFNLFGLSVLSFTTVMGVLIALSYLALFLFLNRQVKNKLILLFGFSTLVFYFLENGGDSIPYFQYSPIRILFPSLALLLVSFYVKNKNKLLYYFIFLTSTVAILWNLDSGIIVFVSWIIALCYGEMYNQKKILAIKKIFSHITVGLFMLLMSFGGYGLYAVLRSGYWPDWSLLWRYQKMFLAGYFMIPMPFPHIWLVVALIFLVGLLLAVKGCWSRKNNESRNFVILFLSVMGLGMFSYYEGRSHDVVFYAPLYTVILLLTILMDIVYYDHILHRGEYRSYGPLFLFILFFILSSPLNLSYNFPKYYSWLKTHLVNVVNKPETIITRNVDFIKDHTKKGESIIVLSENPYEGIFYAESGTKSAIDLPASTDIFFKNETKYLINFLQCNNEYKLFIYPLSGHIFYDEKVNEVIKSGYDMVDKNEDSMGLLIRNNSSTIECIDISRDD